MSPKTHSPTARLGRLITRCLFIGLFCVGISIKAEPVRQALPRSDTHSIAAAEAKTILAAICPNDFAQQREPEGVRLGCVVCPDGVRFSADFGVKLIWTASTIVRGHFRDPKSDDLIVGMVGCEPHVSNFGGSVLLTNQRGKLRKIWYQPALITNRCLKVPSDSGRDLLLCEDLHRQTGVDEHLLFLVDPNRPSNQRMSEILRVTDTMRTCSTHTPLRRAYMKRVEVGDIGENGVPDITVVVDYAVRKPLTQRELGRYCRTPTGTGIPSPQLTEYKFQFVFKEGRFAIAPGSVHPATLFPE